MIHFNTEGLNLKLRVVEGKTQVFDPVRKKWVVLTPEEHVRQYLIQLLGVTHRYPVSLMAVEKQIAVGGLKKRFDVVVFSPQHTAWMMVECKAPDVVIDENVLLQLLNYHRAIPCRYWLLTNGHQLYCADAQNPENIVWLQSLPAYNF